MQYAMILAAGRGERMRPFTDSTPKVLLPIADKPLIVHQIEKLVAAGVEHIVINTAHLGQQIHTALGDGSQFGTTIHYSIEQPSALGTAGGIIQALPLLGTKPFILTSGDVWTDYDYAKLAQSLAPNKLAHLVLINNPDHNPKGDFDLINTVIKHQTGATHYSYTYSNIAVFNPTFFKGFPPGHRNLGELLYEKANQLLISGEHYAGYWRNINTTDEKKQLEMDLISI